MGLRRARAPQRWSLFASHFSKNAKRLQQSFSDGAWKISRTGGRRCVLSGSILDIVVLDRHEVAQGKIIFHRYASDRTCFSAPDTGHDILITKVVATSKREKVSSPPSPRPPCPRTRHARTVACCAVIAPCARTHLQICPARRRGTTESNSYDPRACAGGRLRPRRKSAALGGERAVDGSAGEGCSTPFGLLATATPAAADVAAAALAARSPRRLARTVAAALSAPIA